MGLALTLEPLEPFHLETVLFGSAEGKVPFRLAPVENGQNQMERSQKRTDMKIRDDALACFIISPAEYRRKLEFCDWIHIHTPL